MPERTSLQQAILEYAKENPNATGNEISSEVGCSSSYANQIRRANLDAIVGENDLSDFSKAISLAHPYQILATDECLSQIGLKDKDIVELEIEHKNRDVSVEAPIISLDNFDRDKELHALTYGLTKLYPNYPENIEKKLGNFTKDSSDEDLSIYTKDAFSDYLDQIKNIVQQKNRKADILIGVGIASLGVDIDDDPENNSTINIPGYTSTSSELRDVLSDDSPILIDMREYDGDIASPDQIIFRIDANISESEKSQINKRIKDMKYIDLNVLYYPSGKYNITGGQTFESGSRVVNVEESDVVISTTGVTGCIFNGPQYEFDDIANMMEKSEFSIDIEGDSYDVTKDIDYENERILLSINSFTLPLVYHGAGILIIYPEEIESLDNFSEGIFEFLSNELEGLDHGRHSIDENSPPQSESWIIDTNAVYHQIINDDASSILKTFLPNLQLYDRDIILPWPVLYEINKHKDSSDSGPPPSVQEIGIDNLKTLKSLGENGFINLDVRSVPKDIKTKVSESHVADLHILQKAQSSDAVLLSGDKRLREISRISDTEVVDIHEYAVVEDVPDLSSEIWEQVHTKIGNEIKSQDEILEEINKAQSEALDREYQDIGSRVNPDSEIYLQQWVSDGDIIPYYKQGENEDEESEIMYDQAVSQDVVITPSVAAELTNHIESINGKDYLTKEILDELRNMLNLPSPGLPLITLHVPVSSVLGPQSVSMGGLSAEGRQFYQLKQLENAEYNVTEVQDGMASREKVQASVQLARDKQYTILCTQTDRYIDPIGNLLGVDVEKCDL